MNAVFLNAIAPQIEAAIAERGVHDWRATVPARQQVDTPKRLLLTSSAFGPLRSCNLDNLESGSVNRLFPLWYHTCPEFCHIELTSESLFLSLSERVGVLLLKIIQHFNFFSLDGHLVYIDARDAFQVLRVKPDDTGLEETRRIEVPTGRWLRYLKARWPYLVSGNTSYIAIWDLSSGRLVQEIELLTPQQVAYVDFNPDWIFLCCRSGLKLVSRTTGRVEHDLPPPIARPKNHEGEGGPEATGPSVEQELSATGGPLFQDEDDTSDSEVESVDDPSLADLLPTQLFLQSDWPPSDPLPTVTAAHHDPSTSVLVALFERNMFMISSLEPLGGTATVFAWMPGHTFTQIAVENGRAAVVAESDSQPGQTLFLLHFNAFDSCEAFMARPASLTVVDPVMPAFASISRIEMDSTAIYVTGSSMSPGQARQRNAMNDYCASDKHYQKIGWSWYTPDGQRIPLPVEGVAGREEDHGLGGLTTRDPNQEVTERPASDTLRLDLDAFSDSVVVYRFDQTRG